MIWSAIVVVASLLPPVLARDLGIRFNKVMIDPRFNTSNIKLPLTADDYPIKLPTFRWLRYVVASTLIIPEACRECYWDFDDLLQVAGPPPPYPDSNSSSLYWEELAHVARIQKLRRKNVDAKSIMPLPRAWENFTLSEVAEAVHDEFLGIYHINLLRTWNKEKSVMIDKNIIPFVSIVDFSRSNCMLAELVTWAVARVAPTNFSIKWFVGYPRPEEVAYKVSTGEITKGPPASLKSMIAKMNLIGPTNFTAFPEGSPRHPSWPAMHAASSAASLWMPVVMIMTPDQLCQVQLTDYAVSYARTVAGVHYPVDNLAGLKLGHEVIARLLPEYLNEKYGSSIERIKEKIESVRVDWENFLDTDCAKGLIS